MKRLFFIISIVVFATTSMMAQSQDQQYRRSSLYSILISHTNEKYCHEIEEVFLSIPIPDKFDNHDLSVKVLWTDSKKEDVGVITSFLDRNHIARRLVAKWFNRNPENGQCNMDLIAARGLYDASWFDQEIAKMSQRGLSILSDAGEELIHNTYVVVNDITYVDRNKGAKAAGAAVNGILTVGGLLLDAILGTNIANAASDLGNTMQSLISEIKGFGVTVTSYLYRLEWNDAIAEEFYASCYIGEGQFDETKRKAFESCNAFSLKYVGSQKVKSGDISMAGVSENDLSQMIMKVCTRSIDKSIVALQKNYDEFKIKTPIYSVYPSVTAKIGMKEGVSETSKYEVLEQTVNASGRTQYRRVGVIQPIKGKIWDNRFMAGEEGANGADLGCTTFRIVSGSNFYPGMLIREIKSN